MAQEDRKVFAFEGKVQKGGLFTSSNWRRLLRRQKDIAFSQRRRKKSLRGHASAFDGRGNRIYGFGNKSVLLNIPLKTEKRLLRHSTSLRSSQ